MRSMVGMSGKERKFGALLWLELQSESLGAFMSAS